MANSSLSNSASGNAPQLTGTNGPFERGDVSWMNLARRSLPTPLSPMIRTFESTSATRAATPTSLSIAGPYTPRLDSRSAPCRSKPGRCMCHSGGLADTVRGVRRCPLVSVRYSSRLLSTRRGECVTSSVLLVESLTANLIMLNQRVVYNARQHLSAQVDRNVERRIRNRDPIRTPACVETHELRRDESVTAPSISSCRCRGVGGPDRPSA